MRRNILTFAGILGVIFGTLFMLQGLGVIDWPASSSMLGSQVWITRGAVIAVLSALLIASARFVPGRRRRD